MNKTKSQIAVIAIGILLLSYAGIYLLGLLGLFIFEPNIMTFLLLLFPLILVGCIVATIVMRMKEISDGELEESKKY